MLHSGQVSSPTYNGISRGTLVGEWDAAGTNFKSKPTTTMRYGEVSMPGDGLD